MRLVGIAKRNADAHRRAVTWLDLLAAIDDIPGCHANAVKQKIGLPRPSAHQIDVADASDDGMKFCMSQAIAHANALAHQHVGTEHILLALLEMETALGLASASSTMNDAIAAVLDVLGPTCKHEHFFDPPING